MYRNFAAVLQLDILENHIALLFTAKTVLWAYPLLKANNRNESFSIHSESIQETEL